MATKRFGYLDDFTLKNTKVGIGTSTPQEKLEVIGGTRSKDLKVIGIATLSSYGGFLNRKTTYNTDNITIDSGESATLSGEIVVGAGLTMTVGTGATTGQGSIKSLKVSNTFIPPIGVTADRPSAPKPGALFYNKDFRTIEYWDGSFWRRVDNTTISGRAVIGGTQIEASDEVSADIYSIQIPTQGNATNFGDLTVARSNANGACGSSTRGLFGGGFSAPTKRDTIDYVTIASAGNAIDFGNLTDAAAGPDAFSSSTRGLWAGGVDPAQQNEIEYVEIASTGNATDFGDLIEANTAGGTCSSPIRGVYGGGYAAAGETGVRKRIQFVTISSKGNAVRFGELTAARKETTASSNDVRGIFAGGGTPQGTSPSTDSGKLKVIDYITIASEGNATDFGSLIEGRMSHTSTASPLRVVIMGGDNQTISPKPYRNSIEYVTIATTGNAMDFGDLPLACKGSGATSDCHGGLGGF